MDGIDAVAGKFRSGNAVPIDRAVITADEWASIVAERDKLRAERDSVIAERDRLREVMAASAFVARGMVWCVVCGKSHSVNASYALAHGWPKCCGQTMTIDSPEERKQLAKATDFD